MAISFSFEQSRESRANPSGCGRKKKGKKGPIIIYVVVERKEMDHWLSRSGKEKKRQSALHRPGGGKKAKELGQPRGVAVD